MAKKKMQETNMYVIDDKSKGGVGRPKKTITDEGWDRAEFLCSRFCTGEEIAASLKIDYDTLLSAVKSKGYSKFSDWWGEFAVEGKISLRSWQFAQAKKNVVMSKWLGVQYLNQKDKIEEHHTGQVFNMNFTDEQVEKGIEMAKEAKESNE